MTRRTLLAGALLPLFPPALAGSAALGVHPRPLRFPVDFGSHPDTRVEWWYITGSLDAAGITHGFQITFFRSRTGVPATQPSRFAATQLVFAHAAVSDMTARRLRHDQRIARAGFHIAEASEGDTAVSLRDWRLVREGPPSRSVYRAQAASENARFSFDLALAATQPVLLQGDAGLSHKGPQAHETSHYYSEPQLAVRGTLALEGRAVPVTGSAWLDHEWSDNYLAHPAVGWDWIGMNLADGSALMAFRMRRAEGSAIWAGGSFRAPGQPVQDFAADAVRFTPGRMWRSAGSGASYPVEWTIDTPAGRFVVKALLDNQELDSRASTGAVYWEGLSELLDAQGRRVGRGYLEMTGYAAALKL